MPSSSYYELNGISRSRRSATQPSARHPLIQRQFEVEDLFARARFVQAAQINGGAVLQARLEIEEPAGRLPRRQHHRGQGPAFDLPFVQRVLFALEHFDFAAGAVDGAGAPRGVQVPYILGRSGLDTVVVGTHVFRLEAVQADRSEEHTSE